MFKYLLLICLISLNITADELKLDDMLKEYQDSASLYKKTKQDASGYILIYSREDLDRMQAFTLKDILNNLRLFTLQLNLTGALQLQKVGQAKNAVPPIKLYIDNYEVTTVLQGNALDMYADMDIYFVDHIEIYQSSSSFSFGNMPGSMVIRLYSKDPQRENLISSQISIDSKSSYNLRVLDAGVSENGYDYMLYADASQTKFDDHYRDDNLLSRDALREQFHFMISKKDDFELEIDGINNKTDIFNGFGSAPLGDYSIRAYGFLNYTKYFTNDLKISLSTSIEHKKALNSDENGIRLYSGATTDKFKADAISNTYKIIVEKKVIHENSDLLLGTQFQQNRFNTSIYEVDNLDPTFGADKIDIYMVYMEELYNLDDKNLIAISAKLDHYRDNHSKNTTDYSARLGYISHFHKNYKTKLFLNRLYLYPTMLQSSFSPPVYEPNPNLKNTEIKIATGEIEYFDDQNKAIFGYAHKIIDNAIVFSKTAKKYVNKTDRVFFNRIYIQLEHKFDLYNKILVGYYKGYKENYASPSSGATIELFNKIGNIDIYNSLVFRDGYTFDFGAGDVRVDDGYDYTLALTYPYSKDIVIKVKGENLLDKSIKTPIDAQGLIQIPAIERRAIISMEYTF